MSLATQAIPPTEWGCLTPQQKLMLQLLLVIFFSLVAVPVPLLIPINDPREGPLNNMAFFYGYNVFVIVYYLPARWAQKLRLRCWDAVWVCCWVFSLGFGVFRV